MTKAVTHKNGQIAHRMVKPKPDTIARAVETKHGLSTANQALADREIEIWAKHWNVGVVFGYCTDKLENDT